MKRVLAGLVCILMLLSGCSRSVPITSLSADPVFPAPSVPYSAPEGVEDLQYTSTWPLFLPSPDGSRLLSDSASFSLEHGASPVRPVLSALFAAGETERHLSLGGRARLSLSSRYPVETGGGVCTIQLDTSILALSESDLYTAALAAAATLENLQGIRYVNMLVNERAVGLDLTGNLPLGSVTRHPDVELSVLFNQMMARKTPLGTDASLMPLSSAATLYFPLPDFSGFLAEVQTLTFPGQTPQQLALGLIRALSAGPQGSQMADMPDLASLLASDPEVSDLPGGGRLLTIRLTSDAFQQILEKDMDPVCLMACMVYTLTTFIPSVGAVRFFTGPTLVTEADGGNLDLGILRFEDGLQRRHQYTGALKSLSSIYLIRDRQLTEVVRAVPATSAVSPAALFSLLCAGPTGPETDDGISGIFPGSIPMDGSDLLGISTKEDTLLLNLSGRCRDVIRQAGDQQLTAYALVLTFGEFFGVNHVRFFFDSSVPDTLDSRICWGGDFMLNHALVKDSRR